MGFFDRHPKFHQTLLSADEFFEHPFHALRTGAKAFARWVWTGLAMVGRYLWAGIRRQAFALSCIAAVLASIFILMVAAYCGIAIYFERQMAPVGAAQRVVYLDQGWGGTEPTSDDRLNFYYLPQGAFLKDIRYDWLANLERPWKTERFADPKYMRAYGFIVDPSEVDRNPGRLPIGFSPRYDPKYNEMMLDLNCSVCHTGELHVVRNNERIAVRVDGAPGHQDFTGSSAGHFAGDLAVSMTATYLNHWKFRRFAAAILKDQDTSAGRSRLSAELWDVLKNLWGQAIRERRLGIHPVPDGYGRTDGLGGIMNAAFAVNLDFRNYRVANAPVSYPFIWEIPWFNWVQYTTSVRQPMARNIGEAMGTGARYYLHDPYGNPLPASERFDASLKVANLTHIEDLLRRLRAPCWPEDLFGAIDREKAAKGRDLFNGKFHCAGCHGPHLAPAFYTAAEAPTKLEERNGLINPVRSHMAGGPPQETWQFPPDAKPPYRLDHWIITALPGQEIGTDVTSALNFFRYRVDLTGTGMTAKEVRNELTPYWTTNYKRQIEYYANLLILIDPKINRPLTDPGVIGDLKKYKLQTAFGNVVGSLGLDPAPFQVPFFRSIATRRLNAARYACGITADPGDVYTGAPIQLDDLTDTDRQAIGSPTLESACTRLRTLIDQGLEGYLNQHLGNIDLASVSGGEGLNYLITLVRKRAYQDMDVNDQQRVEQLDGYGQIDTPQEGVQYHARPLAGVWASPPFLHNGSVPSLYELLLPAYQRSKQFYLKTPNFDPRAVGLYADASEKGAFLFDTSLPGNSNAGHEFRAGFRSHSQTGGMPLYGVIGPEMTDDERWAIIEYLKIHRDMYDPVCPETKYLPEEKKP